MSRKRVRQWHQCENPRKHLKSLDNRALLEEFEENIRENGLLVATSSGRDKAVARKEANEFVACIKEKGWSGEKMLQSLRVEGGNEASWSNDLRAAVEESMKRDVYCRFNVFDIQSIDEKTNSITAKLYLELAWEEQSLRPSEMISDWSTIWTPTPIFQNRLGEFEEIKAPWVVIDEDYSKKFEKTMICWRTIVRGSFQQQFDFEFFPFDLQRLRVVIEMSVPDVRIKRNREYPSQVSVEQFGIKAAWKCHFEEVKVEEDRSGPKGNYARVVLKVKAERQPEYWVVNVGLLMFAIVSLGFTTFALPTSDTSDRLQLVLTLFLTAVAYKLLIAERLPDLPYLTLLDMYVLLGIGILCFIALECVAVAWLSQLFPQIAVEFDKLVFRHGLLAWLDFNATTWKQHRCQESRLTLPSVSATIASCLTGEFIILGFTTFALPTSDTSDRLQLVLTLFFTAVAYKLLVAERLPDLPYLTLLHKYVLLGIGILCFRTSLLTANHPLSTIMTLLSISATIASCLKDKFIMILFLSLVQRI